MTVGLRAAAAALDDALARLAGGDADGAGAAAEVAVATVERVVGDTSPLLVNPLVVLARAHADRGCHGEAERLLQRAFALVADDGSLPAVRQRVTVLAALGAAQRDAGRYDLARATLIEALAVAEATFGAQALETADVVSELGVLAKYAGAVADAVALHRRALTGTVAALGADHVDVATVEHNLAGALHAAGDAAAAEAHARRSVEVRQAALGPDHVAVVADKAALAAVLLDVGRFDEAEALLLDAYDYYVDRFGEDHVEAGFTLHNLGVLSARRGDAATAARQLAAALHIKQRRLGEHHPATAQTRAAYEMVGNGAGSAGR